jgi:predicted amidohydrolase
MNLLRLGLVQYVPTWCDPVSSLESLERLLAHAPATDLLVLPEMSFTGFTMDAQNAVLPSSVLERLSGIALERKTGIVYGAVEDGSNRAVLLDREGRRTGSYDKRHLFSLGSEPLHYRPGAAPADWVFEDWRIRPAICYDLRFPYHFWNGADSYDLILVPACWPSSREPHWKTLLTARAIENQAWVAGVNRLGEEPGLSYSGASRVVSPAGKPVLEAEASEGVHVVEIARSEVATTRNRYPFLADRLDPA